VDTKSFPIKSSKNLESPVWAPSRVALGEVLVVGRLLNEQVNLVLDRLFVVLLHDSALVLAHDPVTECR